jgi:hypothetical protein
LKPPWNAMARYICQYIDWDLVRGPGKNHWTLIHTSLTPKPF